MEITKLEEKRETAREDFVTNIMHEMGVPAHLKGYHYLRSAILMTGSDMRLVGSATKLLYPEVAKQFKTTGVKVERSIRNAIEISWPRGKVEYFDEIFGYSLKDGKTRPTNSEYIACVADIVQLIYRRK